MGIRDKMTPKTDEQLYQLLLEDKNPKNEVILILKYSDKLGLLDKLIKEPDLDITLKEKWKKALSEVETFGLFNEIKNPNRETIVNADENEYDQILKLLPMLDVELRKRWKEILMDLYLKE
jgi:hypothetical protein